MRRTPAIVVACVAGCAVAAPAHAVSVQELGAPAGLTPQEHATVQELGNPAAPALPPADCPGSATNECQTIAQVTGFQVQIGSQSTPFRIRKAGYVIAFTLRLAKPVDAETTYFKTTFGSTPKVRLSIIRKTSEAKKEFKLLQQSQPFNMEPYFKSTQTFALHQPFRVHRDDIVALTVPTWLPAFAHGLGNDVAWRSSHAKDECAASNPPAAAQEKIGSKKRYECFYRGARLLYSATFVPDPTVTNPAAAR